MPQRDDASSASSVLRGWSAATEQAFALHRRVLAFDEFVSLVMAHPELFARNSAQYLLDAIGHFGRAPRAGSALGRHALFDAPFDGGEDRVIGQEAAQAELVRVLENFVRERRINRMILIHGPNGSAKSSWVGCLMRAIEAYSHTDEGAIYRFNWVFPSRKLEGSRIGFGADGERRPANTTSFAYLEHDDIDCTLAAEHNDNPLFLIPRPERQALLERSLGAGSPFIVSDTIRKGDLGPRSRAVFDALLHDYRGDLERVYRHVQVERFFFSRRYRRGCVTVEPQLRVDASTRQLTVDRSLASLPAVLQTQTLFETFGPLAEGNRGIIEYNDLLKRPMEANKYLLATSEKGSVSLDTGEIHLDTLLIATANESYLEAFKSQPDWASYKGRIELVRMPYLLDWRDEQQIYDELLSGLRLQKPVAPHTTFAIALWAVLTRLRKPNAERYAASIRAVIAKLTPLQKAMLYAGGELPAGLTAEQSQELRNAIVRLASEGAESSQYEGRHGASAREMKTMLLNAANASHPTLTPFLIFDELEKLLRDRSVYEWLRIDPDGEYHRPDRFVVTVREMVLDRVEREVRDATGLVDDAEHARVFERYINHVNYSLRKEKLHDAVTGRLTDPDERFMREIETRLGRETAERPDEFRSHLISRIAAWRIDNPSGAVDLARIFPVFFDRLRDEYYASKRREVRRVMQSLLTLLDPDAGVLDEADAAAARALLDRLVSGAGYSPETAAESISVLMRERWSETE